MVDSGIGDFFISDVDDDAAEDDEIVVPPIVVAPVPTPAPAAAPQAAAPEVPTPVSEASVPVTPAPEYEVGVPAPAQQPADQVAAPAAQIPAERPQAQARPATREDQLADTLNRLIESSPDVQAAALVSLDGFIMASALPVGMQEDRVGAMSAAILGLGERAAAELGKGHLTQVFIEGEGGYVMLIAAGDRAVLTVLAAHDAKLGLVLYDMSEAAEAIANVLR